MTKVTIFLYAASLKIKMSRTPAEKSVRDLIDLFHEYTKPDDTIDKPDLLKLLQENFPHFLQACVSWGHASHCLGPGMAEVTLWC